MASRIVNWMRAGLAALAMTAGLEVSESRAAASSDAGAALHIAFVGDSMADGLWGALFRRLGKDKCLGEKLKLIRKAKNGTGLTRLDRFNWIDEVATLRDESNPEVFVGSFGINDRQPIVGPDKSRTDFGGPAFDARYQGNVEALVRGAIASGGSVVIVGLPVMLDAEANSDAAIKNKLFAAGVKAVASPLATYAEPWSSQSPPDEYKPFLPNAKNAMVQVRASDGIHFTTAGYDMVMEAVFPSILASLKQRGRDLVSECPGQLGLR